MGADLSHILIATDDETLRTTVREVVHTQGFNAISCGEWPEVLAILARKHTRLVLLDGELPRASAPLMAALASSLDHSPQVVVVRGDLPPLARAVSRKALARVLEDLGQPQLTASQRDLLPLCGLGANGHTRLIDAAQGPLPVWITGERGTGKEWVARILHRLHDELRPFLVATADEPPTLRGRIAGTLYLENADRHPAENIAATRSLARATGWRIIAGSRRPEPAGAEWLTLPLRPLRARPRDLRALVKRYSDLYQRRLGMPRRRFAAGLLRRMEQHPWPGNQRELEAFVVQAVTSARGRTVSETSLPRRVLELLDSSPKTLGRTQAYEEMVEAQLRPLVQAFTPGSEGPGLHRLVTDATERALFRLALARTGGNQKAAATLLGIARNTLRTKLARLEDDE